MTEEDPSGWPEWRNELEQLAVARNLVSRLLGDEAWRYYYADGYSPEGALNEEFAYESR